MPETIHLAIGIALAVSFIAMGASFQSYYGNEPVVPPAPYDFASDKKLITWFNDNFVSEGEWIPHNAKLTTSFEDLDKKVDGLQGSVTLLQAKGDVTTLPNPTFPSTPSTINLNLAITDNGFNKKPSGYPRDVGAILITGISDMKDKSYIITIADPSGAFVKDKFGKTLSDGDVSEAWIPVNALPGLYKVTITIDLKSDSIEFTLL